MKKIIALVILLNCALPVSAQPSKGQNLKDYCQSTYRSTTRCPVQACRLTCITHEDDPRACTAQCLPRQCFEIQIEYCPLEECGVVKGCDGKYICYPKLIVPAAGCGGLGYQGGDVECCEGFVKRCGVEYFDGRCDKEPKNSVNSVPVCLPCGDKICGQFENKCNCEEDCK